MNQKAFTLIELLVAIAIVGILAGFVFVQLNNASGAAMDAKKKTGVDALRKAVLFYDVEEGRYPIEDNPCTVGVDCDNLDTLENLPRIPSDLTYTYQSDGTDCTISIVLSTGHVYEYNCLANSYQAYIPIVGNCGPSTNGNYYTSSEIANPCSSGTTFAISGSGAETGYFTWTCSGANGGIDSGICTANLKVDGVCAIGLSYYSAPSSGSCNSGTSTAVSGSGPWYWGCTGINEGVSTANDACLAVKKIDGQCGSSNGGTYASAPTSGLCNAGTPSTSGSWSWVCYGANGGNNSGTCTAYLRQSCSALGGTTTMCGSTSCCQLSMANCPAGWNYTGYNSTSRSSYSTNGSCESASHDANGYSATCSLQTCYYSGYHTWTTASNSNEWVRRDNYCGGGTTYWYSTVIAVGCY